MTQEEFEAKYTAIRRKIAKLEASDPKVTHITAFNRKNSKIAALHEALHELAKAYKQGAQA